MRKIAALLLLCMLILTACSDIGKTLTFSGTGPNWEVTVTSVIQARNSEARSFAIRYLGGDSAPESISYVIEGGPGTLKGNQALEGGVLNHSGTACRGCAVTQEDAKLHAEITWGDKTETIDLIRR
ncbi:hypothetical protein KIH86_01755 [Paenibacillus sp. HN-1]|uniref:hypothetical protein n=1 Tax=Paenibacillus TaxID=44249 RepID=UPI001CA7CA77|nr:MULTISPECIES: hypothetical protein [Paenibacillus]MBY9079708.1 hypothetical protein [Paenibacillus sp. CGMCC 1.18879]MBY9082959.1 hypothetical protein [Paenibacillus sinensis]